MLYSFFYLIYSIFLFFPLATYSADVAYATFGLLNSIIYLVWTIILSVHRKAVTISQKEAESAEGSAAGGGGGKYADSKDQQQQQPYPSAPKSNALSTSVDEIDEAEF